MKWDEATLEPFTTTGVKHGSNRLEAFAAFDGSAVAGAQLAKRHFPGPFRWVLGENAPQENRILWPCQKHWVIIRPMMKTHEEQWVFWKSNGLGLLKDGSFQDIFAASLHRAVALNEGPLMWSGQLWPVKACAFGLGSAAWRWKPLGIKKSKNQWLWKLCSDDFRCFQW